MRTHPEQLTLRSGHWQKCQHGQRRAIQVHAPLLSDELLCRLDLFVELLNLLVMAVTLFVIRIQLQALTHLTANYKTEGGRRKVKVERQMFQETLSLDKTAPHKR